MHIKSVFYLFILFCWTGNRSLLLASVLSPVLLIVASTDSQWHLWGFKWLELAVKLVCAQYEGTWAPHKLHTKCDLVIVWRFAQYNNLADMVVYNNIL